MASSEGDKLLVGVLHAVMDKIEANCKEVELKMNESSYIKDTFSERFQL